MLDNLDEGCFVGDSGSAVGVPDVLTNASPHSDGHSPTAMSSEFMTESLCKKVGTKGRLDVKEKLLQRILGIGTKLANGLGMD